MIVTFENELRVVQVGESIHVYVCNMFHICAVKSLYEGYAIGFCENETTAEEDFLWKLNRYFFMKYPVRKVCGGG